jgi:hypothetical protein
MIESYTSSESSDCETMDNSEITTPSKISKLPSIEYIRYNIVYSYDTLIEFMQQLSKLQEFYSFNTIKNSNSIIDNSTYIEYLDKLTYSNRTEFLQDSGISINKIDMLENIFQKINIS